MRPVSSAIPPAMTRALRVSGLARLSRALGGMSAVVAALVWSRTHVPPMVERWLLKHRPTLFPESWDPKPTQTDLDIAHTQPHAFTLILVAVMVAAGAWFAVDALLGRWRVTRLVALGLGPVAAIAAVRFAWRASPFLGQTSAMAVVLGAFLFAAEDRGGRPLARSPEPARQVSLASVLVAEALCVGWGIWLTCWSVFGITTIVLLFALAVVAAFRAARLLALPEGVQALEREAIVGAPLLALPMIGLVRDPSLRWLAVAAGASLVLYVLSKRLTLQPGTRSRAIAVRMLASFAATWAVLAFVIVPMRFRELGDVNHFAHEGQHLGWINSVSFGKLMMADASFIYGPLREYLLALYCAVSGMTFEHAREAHIVANLAGVALMLYVGWRIARGRPWLHFWWAYILVCQTQIYFLISYRSELSFGWVDLAREGFASLALIGGIDAVTSAAPSGTWRALLRDNRKLALWGAFCGLATLYSQDYGPCAFGSVGLAIGADSFLRRGLGGVGARILRSLRLASAWTLGLLATIALFFLVYALFGKAGLCARRIMTWTGLLVSGGWSGGRFPLGPDSFLQWGALSARDDHGSRFIQYAVPPLLCFLGGAVVVMAAVRRAWSPRTTLLFSLFAFAATSVRHAMIRTDIFHVRSDGLACVLLFFAIMCDVCEVRVRVGRLRRELPLGAIVCAIVAYGWTATEESWNPLKAKLHALATGEESPSTGARYDNHDVKRAGDVNVPANVKALVVYIGKTTKRTDPVWVSTDFIGGGELAFAIARRNPTPFDVAHELITHADQAELLHVLQTDPPTVIVGEYFNLVGKDVKDYVAAHWKAEPVPGYGSVRRYEGR